MNELFEDLDFKFLKNYLIFLDIDGTIVADNQNEISEKVLKKIEWLKRHNKIFLCTNSHNQLRNFIVEKKSTLKLLINTPRKPSKKILKVIPKEFLNWKYLVIGDKFLIDGIFAKRIGADFIKVRRIKGKDRFIIRILNVFDDFIYNLGKMLKKK